MLKKKLQEARKRANIMDKMSREWEHKKAQRAFEQLHAIYLWLIDNWYNPRDYYI